MQNTVLVVPMSQAIVFGLGVFFGYLIGRALK